MSMDNKKITLITVPYAGGTSATYIRLLKNKLDGNIIYYDYPHHGARFGEKSSGSIEEIAVQLAETIANNIIVGKEFSIFGHSMGAMVSYCCEVILEQNYGLCANTLFLSACLPPKLFYRTADFFKSYDEITDYLINKRNLSYDLIKSEEFFECGIKPFFNDLELIKRFIPNTDSRISAPIVALCGTQDEDISPEDMCMWQEHTKNDFRLFKIFGDHFFIETNKIAVLEILMQYGI